MQYLSLFRFINITLISLTVIVSNSAQSCTLVNRSTPSIYEHDTGANDECDTHQIIAKTSYEQPNQTGLLELETKGNNLSMSVNSDQQVPSDNALGNEHIASSVRTIFGVLLGLIALFCLRSNNRY